MCCLLTFYICGLSFVVRCLRIVVCCFVEYRRCVVLVACCWLCVVLVVVDCCLWCDPCFVIPWFVFVVCRVLFVVSCLMCVTCRS